MATRSLREELEIAYEARDEAAKHRKKLEDMKSLPLGGKKTKMGEGYLFNADGTKENAKAAEGAYDAVANIAESAAEDAEENERRAVARWRKTPPPPLLIDAPPSRKRK